MRRIKQRHANTCAVATLAMLTDKAYDKVLKAAHPKRKPRQIIAGMTLVQITKYLNKLGMKYKIHLRSSKMKVNFLKNKAYVSIKVRSGYHALAWDIENKKILDPSNYSHSRKLKYVNKHYRFIIEILK